MNKLTNEEKERLLILYPEYDKVYGPYHSDKDFRSRIFLRNSITRKNTTISGPKIMMELYLNRRLSQDETVDHINNQCYDDRIENLQLLSRADNIHKSAKGEEFYTFNCPECGEEATKPMNQVKHNWVKGSAGPFCSRECAGRYSRDKQMGIG